MSSAPESPARRDEEEAREREFLFTTADFEHIRAAIYARAGITLGDNKKDMVYSRIARRLRALGLRRFDQYFALLDAHNGAEWEHFVNSLTTNLTAFYREPHHFPILAKFARERPAGLTVWCAAASTGEEPYSIAMTLIEAYATGTPPVRLLASDVDTQVLSTAQAGRYPLSRVNNLSGAQLKQHFLKGTGCNEGHVRIRPELQAMITFRQINLLALEWPLRGPFDVIFCRNVMIYFDKPTQRRILERFHPLLAPDGLLFAGHSESFYHATDLFRPLGKTVYTPISGANR